MDCQCGVVLAQATSFEVAGSKGSALPPLSPSPLPPPPSLSPGDAWPMTCTISFPLSPSLGLRDPGLGRVFAAPQPTNTADAHLWGFSRPSNQTSRLKVQRWGFWGWVWGVRRAPPQVLGPSDPRREREGEVHTSKATHRERGEREREGGQLIPKYQVALLPRDHLVVSLFCIHVSRS